MTTALFIWACFTAILGALIFQAKNRSPFTGAVVGFFLNLIGLVILVCFSKRPPETR